MAFPLLLILKWARRIMSLFPLPDWNVSEEVRNWTIKALGLADEIADETSTQIDDKVVDALRKVVDDTETWEVFYALILDLISGKKIDHEQIKEVAERVAVDLGVFQMLLDMILEFIKWWRDRV